MSPTEALGYLNVPLRSVLASLDGAPEAVCATALQLLPFGSRAALEATGIVVPGDVVDGLGHKTLRLTSLAWDVIAEAAAAETETDGTSVHEWERRAEAALAPVGTGAVAEARQERVLSDALASRLR